MTTEASLPADDETENSEAPIEKVLRAVEAAEAAEKAETRVDEPPEAAQSAEPEEKQELPEPPAQDVVAEPPAAAADDGLTDAVAGWTEALRSVERSINDATEAIRFLRATIQQMAPLMRSLGGFEDALSGFEEQSRRQPQPQPLDGEQEAVPLLYDDDAREAEASPPATLPRDDAARAEREWPQQRRKAVGGERGSQWEEADNAWVPPAGPRRPVPKPVTLVPDDTPAPYAYKVTIEDRKSPIELLEVHRALTSIPSVRNLSLLNYVNGVASISLETTDEVQPPELENAIKKIMKRSCSVVPHESNVILIQVGE